MVEFEHLELPQRVAALAHDRNYAVTAGAGSGKTTTFAMRYLKLLEQTDADPHSILAITFTESGATELQDRVRESISDRLDEHDGDDYVRWREYQNALPEGYVHTIHGFCARLLREYALEADVPTGFDVVEETAASALQTDTVERFVDDHLDDPRIERLTRIYYRDRLETLLADLLGEHHLAKTWAEDWTESRPEEYVTFVRERYSPIDIETARSSLVETSVQSALEDIQTVASEERTGGSRITIAQNVADAVEEHGIDRPDRCDEATVHDGMAALCEALTSDGTPYHNAWDSWCYEGYDDWREENADLFETATSVLVEAMPVESWATPDRLGVTQNAAQFYVDLASLYVDLHESYQRRKRRESALDFADLIDQAIELLDASPAARDDLRRAFDYVMLDEVQDTDPRQWELVQLLTSLEDAYDDLNVFVVGDEKQSIFRFRGADVTQYQSERGRLADANERASVEPLEHRYDVDGETDLSRNFRSLPAVLNPINGLFDELFGDVPECHHDAPYGIDDHDTSFEPEPQRLTPARGDSDGIGTGTSFVLVPEEEAVRDEVLDSDHPLRDLPERTAELDAAALAAEIAAFLDDSPQRYEVTGFEDGSPVEEPTDLEPSDVAILLRKRTHLEDYERALVRLNVPYTVASGVGYFESTEIVTLRNCFAVLHDPTDDLSVLGLLRSPMFGFEDAAVLELFADTDRDAVGTGVLWAALENAEDEGLQRVRERIDSWRGLAGATESRDGIETWDALLGRIVEETNFLASLALDERGQQAIANVQKFRDQLRAWSEDGVRTLPELVCRMERQVELSDREGEAAIPSEADGVRIMTIHDAKGQEFPAVFVPGLSVNFHNRVSYGDGVAEFETIEDPVTGDRTPQLGIRGPDVTDVYVQTDTMLKRRLAFHRKRTGIAEEKRILYVAMTRARDHLFVVGTGSCEDDSLVSMDLGDSDDPSNLFDLVGPEILDEEVLEDLIEAGESSAALPSEEPAEIRLPRPGAELERDRLDEPPSLELDVGTRDPNRAYKVPASYVGSLIEDDVPGDIDVDHTGQYVTYSLPTGNSDGGTSTERDPESVPANVFGLTVHKALELDVSADDSDSIGRLAEQFAVENDVDASLITDDVVNEIRRHVSAAESVLTQIDGDHRVDEKFVTAELDGGEVYGYVDQLSVSDETYHVVDYKTNNVADDSDIDEACHRYRWQMKAYAVALHQTGSGRDVKATLVFTDSEQRRTFEWSADELEAIGEELDDTITTILSNDMEAPHL